MEDNVFKLVLFLHHAGPRDSTQVITINNKCLHLLNHLPVLADRTMFKRSLPYWPQKMKMMLWGFQIISWRKQTLAVNIRHIKNCLASITVLQVS